MELPNSVIDSKGVEQSEEGKLLCCWKEYFSTLLTPKLQTHVSLPIAVLPHPVVTTNCELLNCSISLEEFNHAVMSLSNSKSPGAGPAEAKLDWSGLLTLVYANSQMRALERRIRLGGSGGMLSQGNFWKLDALRRLLRPFWT